MTKVSVVIPNWNGEGLLKNCLPSLKKQTLKKFETIIIDNGSTDGSVKYIEKHFPEMRVIKLKQNIGFSPAVNIAVKQTQGEFIVLVNNDTKLDPNFLKYLVKAAQVHPEAGFVTGKMLQFFDPKRIDAAGDYIDAVGHGNNIGFGQPDGLEFNTPGYVFLVSGGGSLFREKVFEEVGLFDDDYFAYFEDADLCLRAQMQGFKGWYEPKAVIYHIHKATSNRNKALTEYLQYRNMTQTVIKNFPRQLLLKDLNWLKIMLVNINTIRYLQTQGYLNSALKAEWYILTHIFTLLKKRQKIQSQIKVSPNYIVENVRPKKVTLFGLLKSGF
jgi:GT2 family glycosyltransferase